MANVINDGDGGCGADLRGGFTGRICGANAGRIYGADLRGGFAGRICGANAGRICGANLRGEFVGRICGANLRGEFNSPLRFYPFYVVCCGCRIIIFDGIHT
jgi:hypothetical protein